MYRKVLFTAALFFSLFIVSCASAGNGNNADWAGIYTGVIPAADCPGISVVAILNANGNYKITYQYIDRDVSVLTYEGIFKWDDASKIITLDGKGLPAYYRVGKQSLTQLDIYGEEITGRLAKNYVLRKVNV